MLLAGDEIGRTQRGNNNAYCQDNEISWFDWGGADRGLTEFVAQIIRLRRDHPLFHRPDWFDPMDGGAPRRRTVGWYDETGREILSGTGATQPPSPLQFFSRGAASRSVDDDSGARGPVDVLVMFNPTDREVAFHVPEPRTDDPWVKVVDTWLAVQPDRENAPRIDHSMTLAAHSLAVLVRPA
jgi:glycogen operon protein